MLFSSVFSRTKLIVLFVLLAGCTTVSEEEIFGYEYEDDFIIPQPDMVPVTPDDKPGRTVDEMLSLKQAVTVKKADYEKTSSSDQSYEHVGRFGSKEKISLRKGLNVPDTGIVYSSKKRKEADVVRALEVKEQEKDPLLTLSEEEMLAEIIAPKAEKVEMIEVVPSSKEPLKQNISQNDEDVIAEKQPEEKPVDLQMVAEKQPEEKETTITLIPPEPQTKEANLTMPEPLIEQTSFVKLTPPASDNEIVLLPPSGEETESSVEIFIE